MTSPCSRFLCQKRERSTWYVIGSMSSSASRCSSSDGSMPSGSTGMYEPRRPSHVSDSRARAVACGLRMTPSVVTTASACTPGISLLAQMSDIRGSSGAWPDRLRDLDDELELAPLVVRGDGVALLDARESALRADREALGWHDLRRLVDAAQDV